MSDIQVPTPENLTLKQQRFLEVYLETGNATEAAWQAYDCKSRDVANAIGSENLAKLSFADILEQGGVTDKRLKEKIDQGLDATKTTNAAILVMKDGKIVKAEEQGLIEVEDYAVQHKYLETALKLKRRLAQNTADSTPLIIEKMLVVPAELLEKNEISSDTVASSQG